jgi:hypothetical protein
MYVTVAYQYHQLCTRQPYSHMREPAANQRIPPFVAATLLLHAPAQLALPVCCCIPLSVSRTQRAQRLRCVLALCRRAQSSPASVKTLCGVATTRASPLAPPEMGAYLQQQQQQGGRGVRRDAATEEKPTKIYAAAQGVL